MIALGPHASLPKRVVRVLLRLTGTPVGTLWMLLLRLSSRRAGVALMYHSVEHRAGDTARELVPPHHSALFDRQVGHLRRYYRIVAASELQDAARARRRGERFPVAITFDDDLECHATVALPILRTHGATATFFLSGASLERPFAFWYERLQRAHDQQLPGLTELILGPDAPSRDPDIFALATAVEEAEPETRYAIADRLGAELGPDPCDAGIRAAHVRELADAGMTIGFHTRRHDALSLLDDDRLASALTDGRAELSEVAGTAVDLIGYPHGRADGRVADAARAVGFRGGFTSRRVAVSPASDPLLQGRIGPSHTSLGSLAVQLAFTVQRA
jgi:peptidoglycan/xylan/chitin deacetylase (PgdA/CDA1 family)